MYVKRREQRLKLICKSFSLLCNQIKTLGRWKRFKISRVIYDLQLISQMEYSRAAFTLTKQIIEASEVQILSKHSYNEVL